MQKKNSLGDISYLIDRALCDLEYKKELDRIEKAKEFAEIASKASQEYADLLRPYDGKRIIDIPIEVIQKADSALRRSKEANKKLAKLMGIKL